MGAFNGAVTPVLNILGQRPVLAVFEVNLRCNSSCGYCDLPLNQGRYEMSRDEIRKVFTSLYDYGLRVIFVQGGEPTLRRDLLQIMQDLHNIGFVQTLVTNGTRLSHGFVEALQAMPVSISVSLDTLNREKYRRIRGADQLNIVLAGINRLYDYPHPKYITCIASEENREDVREVADFARAHGFTPVITPYHWNVGRYGRTDPGLQYDRDAMASLFHEILESGLIPPGYLDGYMRDNIKWLNGKPLGRCDAGRYSVSIDASGNVAACLAMEHAGNLLETNLADILKKMDMEKVRICSGNSGCNVICNRLVDANLRHPIRALRSPDLVRTFSR